MSSYSKCKNCGADYGLHHYETIQCPAGGVEAPVGKEQIWMTTTFEESPAPYTPGDPLNEARRHAEQAANLVDENRHAAANALATVAIAEALIAIASLLSTSTEPLRDEGRTCINTYDNSRGQQ